MDKELCEEFYLVREMATEQLRRPIEAKAGSHFELLVLPSFDDATAWEILTSMD